MVRGWVLTTVLWVILGCKPAPKPASQKEAPAAPVRITHFYISPPVLEAGRQALLCYGVENARSVRLEPEVEPLRPAYNRCIQIAPRRDTRYTLWAQGADGREVSLSVELKVSGAAPRDSAPPPAPLILEFAASAAETEPGRPVTLCYQAAPGTTLRLEPDIEKPAAPRGCFSVSPTQTTRYTLTAESAEGRAESRQLTIQVR